MSATILRGDARHLPFADASVDAVVTDPPYGLEFMGKEWDRFADGFRRAANPADTGRDSVFGRTSRTSPEYRTGKPSSARIRTRVDQRTNPATGKSTTATPEAYVAGVPFQRWCEQWAAECLRVLKPGGFLLAFGGARTWHRLTCAIEDTGFEIRDPIAWLYGSGFPKSLNLGDGRGTALKPAFEPVVVARKPLAGTVAANVERYGTGALNIDACRVPHASAADRAESEAKNQHTRYANPGSNRDSYSGNMPPRRDYDGSAGRWPTNVVLDEAAAEELDQQTGVLTSGANPTRRGADKFRDAYGEFRGQEQCTPARSTDSGGASRFFPVFRYEAKAPDHERPRVNGIAHPTVKPLDLMRWLIRLVTPTGGVVLDPFAGSGTTLEAALLEGFRVVAIERDPDYLPLIVHRLDRARRRLQPGVARLALSKPPAQLDGQLDLLEVS